MPVNKKWNISELLKACAVYFAKTQRRISFEYTMIKNVNDSVENARELAIVLKRYLTANSFHVNLIPVNVIKERNFKPSDPETIEHFINTLETYRINATVRRKLGSDINASCGQLRRDIIKQQV